MPHRTQINPVQKLAGWSAIIGYCLALIYGLDPANSAFGADSIAALRYLPITLMLPAFIIFAIPSMTVSRAWSIAFACVLFLTAYELIFSILWLIRSGSDVSDSFFGRAIALLAIPVGFSFALRPRMIDDLSAKILPIFVGFGLVAMLITSAHASGLFLEGYKQVLHVEAAFIFASIAWLAARIKSTFVVVTIGIIFTWLGISTGKSTYLLLTVAFIGVYFGRSIWLLRRGLRQTGRREGVLLSQAILPLVAVGAAVVLWLGFLVIEERSSRYENDLRLRFYEQRWLEFLDSPIYGKLFQGSPAIRIPGSSTYVPSHNDILDLLALGGAVAAIPFVVIVLATLLTTTSLKMFSMRSSEIIKQQSSMHWYVLVFGTVALTGNPMLAAPSLSLPYLFSLGVVLGMATQARTGTKQLRMANEKKTLVIGGAR